MVKIVIPVCSICKRPLSEAEKNLRITSHFECIVQQVYAIEKMSRVVRG